MKIAKNVAISAVPATPHWHITTQSIECCQDFQLTFVFFMNADRPGSTKGVGCSTKYIVLYCLSRLGRTLSAMDTIWNLVFIILYNFLQRDHHTRSCKMSDLGKFTIPQELWKMHSDDMLAVLDKLMIFLCCACVAY